MRTSTLALFLTASALVGCGSPTDITNLQAQLVAQQQEISAQHQQIAAQQEQLFILSANLDGLNTAIRSNIKSIDSLMAVSRDNSKSILILAERR